MGPDPSDLSLPLIISVPVSPVSISFGKVEHVNVPVFDLSKGSILIVIFLPGFDAVGVLEEHPYVAWPRFVTNSVSSVRVSRAYCGVIINLTLMRSLGDTASCI